MGPGAPDKLGAPVLLETLALYMTFENAKVAEKLEKEYFSNWNDTKRIFGKEIDENESKIASP